MEKISNIVRGSSRVASADVKGSSAVRPGVPSFGRPVGESSAGQGHNGTTASRAVALHNEMLEAKKTRSQDNVATAMADSFFMTRIRRPTEDEVPVGAPQLPKKAIEQPIEEMPQLDDEEVSAQDEAMEAAQPSGYTPRGSFVDVHA